MTHYPASRRRLAGMAFGLTLALLAGLSRARAVGVDVDRDGRLDLQVAFTNSTYSAPPFTSVSIYGSELVLPPGVSHLDLVGAPGSEVYGGFGATVAASVFPAAKPAETRVPYESITQSSTFGVGSGRNFVASGAYFMGLRLEGPTGYRLAWVYMTGGYGEYTPNAIPVPQLHAPAAFGLMPEGATSLTLPSSLVSVRRAASGAGAAGGVSLVVNWNTGRADAVLERTASLDKPDWKVVQTGGHGNLVVDPKATADGEIGFYRVR